MIKRLLLALAVLTTVALPVFVVQYVSAVDVIQGPCSNTNSQGKPELCNDNQTNATDNPIFGPNGILTIAIRVLAVVTGVMSVLIIVVEGFRMVLAGGDSNTAAQARKGILWACVGIVIALISQAIVALVLNKL
ncbi:MAG TPA: hypothetical protein VGO07_02750 [Candidatus Saccharimonadales bacterium]|jgi:hypothetical protein|nr:hypothetical protein [Candidatus Saccharimonadales bacterium]